MGSCGLLMRRAGFLPFGFFWLEFRGGRWGDCVWSGWGRFSVFLACFDFGGFLRCGVRVVARCGGWWVCERESWLIGRGAGGWEGCQRSVGVDG